MREGLPVSAASQPTPRGAAGATFARPMVPRLQGRYGGDGERGPIMKKWQPPGRPVAAEGARDGRILCPARQEPKAREGGKVTSMACRMGTLTAMVFEKITVPSDIWARTWMEFNSSASSS